VDEVLVDGRKLGGQDFVQGVNDFGITSHDQPTLTQPAGPSAPERATKIQRSRGFRE
jgi:hypothetical protein